MKIRGIILFTTLILSTIVLTTSFKIMNNKVEKNPSIAPQAMRGAMAFMDGFEHMFAALNQRLTIV